MTIHKDPRLTSGFVALMAVICISLILLVVTLQVTTLGWYTRTRLLEKEFKVQSIALAHSCAERAALQVILNPLYEGGVTITDARGSCYVFPLQPHVSQVHLRTVQVRTVVLKSYTTLVVIYNMHDINQDPIPNALPANGSESLNMTLESWHEVQ